MTGPAVNYIIRKIVPLDLATVSIHYDLQTSFPGPTGTTTGSYYYRSSQTNVFSLGGLFNTTDITQAVSFSGPLNQFISNNFQIVAQKNLNNFYYQAYASAQGYFSNLYSGQLLFTGYTGSILFTGPGITGSYFINPGLVGDSGNSSPTGKLCINYFSPEFPI